MELEYLILIVAVAGASTLQSASGIGFGVIAGPIMLIVLDSEAAILLSTILSLLIAVLLAPSLWAKVDRRLLARLLAGTVVGLPIGLFVFVAVGIDLLKLMAGLMVVFTLVFLWRAGRGPSGKSGNFEQLSIGALSGIMGASLAMPGPIAAAWMAGRSYGKDTIRATILTMFIVSYTAALILQVWAAGFSADTGRLCMILAVPTVIGVYVGRLLVKHLTEARFTQVLTVVLLATSVSLFVTSIPRLVN